MPKKVFWPAAILTFGLIVLASNMGYLNVEFMNLWPVMLIIIGLGGLITADRDQWLWEPKKTTTVKAANTKTKHVVSTKKTNKKSRKR